MQNTKVRLIVWAFTCSFVSAQPAQSATLTTPDDIKQQVEQIQKAFEKKDIVRSKLLAEEITERIYQWIMENMHEASAREVIEALRPALPVIPDDVHPRLEVPHEEADAITPIILKVSAWQTTGQRAVVVIGVRHISRAAGAHEASLRDERPLIIAKNGRLITSYLVRWRSNVEPNSYVVHGFIAGPTKESFPDVVLSGMASGPLSSVYSRQVHLTSDSNPVWGVIWSEDTPAVLKIDFEPQSGGLQLEVAGVDPNSTKAQVGKWQLVYGSSATLTKRFDSK
jgi:hypothetical protein